jgi:MFS family permease
MKRYFSYAWERVALLFRAFKYKNYRLFFAGQSISLTGTWMQQVALSWLVYRLTNSAFLLGMVGFLTQCPSLLLTPFAGVIADRHNKRYILIVTQSLAMVQATLLTVLILTHTIAIWHVFFLSLMLGFISAFDIPVRQAFTVDMVERREDLGNAIALNSSMFNVARLLGPSLAGILIAWIGEGLCFLLNAVSYLAVILALMAMRTPPPSRDIERKAVVHELKEGIRYAFGFAPTRTILFLLAMVSLVGVPYQVLMPVFARDIFHRGPQALGFLMSMAGIGALIGALYLAMRKSVLGLGRLIAFACGLFGAGLIVFSFSRVLWLSMGIVLLCGFGMMVQMASSNTVLQTIVDEDKRGRMMSFYALAFMGMVPFGSLFAGILASKIGAPATLLIGGILCVIGAVLFAKKLPALREQIRPIYAEKGIIPEVAKGIQLTTRI